MVPVQPLFVLIFVALITIKWVAKLFIIMVALRDTKPAERPIIIRALVPLLKSPRLSSDETPRRSKMVDKDPR